MSYLLLTICDKNYRRIGALTHPSLRAYADRIGADFISIRTQKISRTSIHWEKFQLFDLLNKFDRILFVDADIIIRPDAPNLFDIVPAEKFGAFNEAPFTDRSRELMIDCCKQYGVTLPEWDGRYFNTGVMVISRKHKYLFKKPELEYCSFYEQTYLNMKLAESRVEIFELEYRYNRMCCLDGFTGEERQASWFIHYAGCPSQSLVMDLIRKDIDVWSSGKTNYTRHVAVMVTGGLGDQVCAEPAIRFMATHVFPKDEIVISTHWPRLFQHIAGIKVYNQGEYNFPPDTPYYICNSLPSPETVTWQVVSNLLCHTVDYCSIALLKRTLPVSDRTIQLAVTDADKTNLLAIAGDIDYQRTVLVHPGKHWQSKTLPAEYWQSVVDRLVKLDCTVCIIGADEAMRGTVGINVPKRARDLRNLLDIGSLIALVSQAKILLSNDSAPVHIAGAFDNWIVLLPTCKHPDHVLPYRHGRLYHKAIALYKKLPCDEFNAQPTCVHGSSAETISGCWDDYLMDVPSVINRIKNILTRD